MPAALATATVGLLLFFVTNAKSTSTGNDQSGRVGFC